MHLVWDASVSDKTKDIVLCHIMRSGSQLADTFSSINSEECDKGKAIQIKNHKLHGSTKKIEKDMIDEQLSNLDKRQFIPPPSNDLSIFKDLTNFHCASISKKIPSKFFQITNRPPPPPSILSYLLSPPPKFSESRFALYFKAQRLHHKG